MEILYLPKFARQYKKLPSLVKEHAEKKEKIFRKNPFDPRLKTHKLTGPLEGFLALFACNFLLAYNSNMTKKGITIDGLARMVQKGFEETAKHIDVRFEHVEKRLNEIEIRLDRIENILIAAHENRIERLEDKMRQLETLLGRK